MQCLKSQAIMSIKTGIQDEYKLNNCSITSVARTDVATPELYQLSVICYASCKHLRHFKLYAKWTFIYA